MSEQQIPERRFSVAPMMDWTDRHYRYLARLFSRRALLYTEMVTTAALVHGDRERLLDYHPAEHPLALQLGGSEAAELAECAAIAQDWGYDEVNLNVGCPSDRVQSGRFGACLMAEPEQVARGVEAMCRRVSIPVTVKCRIGIDDQDSWEALQGFVAPVAAAGCETFIVHARKAWLQGLSPRENREVPPLRYDLVAHLKDAFPHLNVVINGGITDVEACLTHLDTFDGVMVGRAAYQRPELLAGVDRRLYGEPGPEPDTFTVLAAYLDYAQSQLARGVPLQALTRHLLGLFQGVPGAKAWRRHISENAHRPGADLDVVRQAATHLRPPAGGLAAAL